MSSLLTHEQIEDLVVNVCGSNKIRYWKNERLQICCPIHGEQHPSCAVNAHWVPDDGNEILQVFTCFACGKSGTLQKLLYLSRQDLFHSEFEAMKYMEGRYGISFAQKTYENFKRIKRYDELFQVQEEVSRREIKPFSALAPFKSGKETYRYFFQRGFTKDEMREYMIGRDLKLQTVTIPVFYEDDALAGIIGRKLPMYCSEYEQRYHVYDFPKGSLLYPLNKFEVFKGEAILVESQLDAILMRRWGMKNVLATMGGTVTARQADLLAGLCEKAILLFDADHGGNLAQEKAIKLLRGRVRIKKVNYPENLTGKDPSEWGEELTRRLIANSGSFSVRRI